MYYFASLCLFLVGIMRVWSQQFNASSAVSFRFFRCRTKWCVKQLLHFVKCLSQTQPCLMVNICGIQTEN